VFGIALHGHHNFVNIMKCSFLQNCSGLLLLF
jgi:hypothetical protein